MLSKTIAHLEKQSTHPTRREAKTAGPVSNTFTAKFDSDKTERFIMRGNQGRVGSTEQMWRENSGPGLRVNTIWVKFHKVIQLCSELSVETDGQSNGNRLGHRMVLEPKQKSVQMPSNGERKKLRNVSKRNYSHQSHGIRNKISALLLWPTWWLPSEVGILLLICVKRWGGLCGGGIPD